MWHYDFCQCDYILQHVKVEQSETLITRFKRHCMFNGLIDVKRLPKGLMFEI